MKRPIVLLVVLLILSCSTDSENEPIIDVAQMMEDTVDPANEENTGELTGTFVDGAHPTSGTATIRGDRKKLELFGFKTDAGPILEFYLATDVDGVDYVTLGVLKGIEGDYIYDLPDDVDFETHKYLLVWCVDFKVNFGHAVLE